MADTALILGESSTGKSASLRNLPRNLTYLIKCYPKELPYIGGDGVQFDSKNSIVTDDFVKVYETVKRVNEKMPWVKYLPIDDLQYCSLFEFVDRVHERDYFQKYTDIAVNLTKLIRYISSCRADLKVFILNHIEIGTGVRGENQIQAKTVGKFVKEKITLEGLFTTVLLCDKEVDPMTEEITHFFWTRLVDSTVRAPMGMFDEAKIPNDLFALANHMDERRKKKAN